ncbi:hypothetical protein [Undibacterium sp. Tian12W]|uniref:hypothetical protein n=1 Tax=Undibacterium sp. Tian12W TaxID=3413054 RepID=UPI003BF18C3C
MSIQQACLNEIRKIWLEAEENMRPYSVWIAEHSPVSKDCAHADTQVCHAWLMDHDGIAKRSASDYVRFRTVQSGVHWNSLTIPALPSAIFNDRPFRIHSIGLASFAPVSESELIYLDFIWGGTFGRGAHYQFDEEKQWIVCVKNVWIS